MIDQEERAKIEESVLDKKLKDTNPKACSELVKIVPPYGFWDGKNEEVLIDRELMGEFKCSSGKHDNYFALLLSRCDPRLDVGCPMCYTEEKIPRIYATRIHFSKRNIHEILYHCKICGSYRWTRDKEHLMYNLECSFCSESHGRKRPMFTEQYPEYASEYMNTDNIVPASEISLDLSFENGISVNWKCNKCDEVYSMSIDNKVYRSKDTACPFCNGTYAHYKDSLAYKYPKIAARYTKFNELPASIVFPSSRRYAYFICDKCGIISEDVISDIVDGEECMFCNAGLTKQRTNRIFREGIHIFNPEAPIVLVRPYEKVKKAFRCSKCGGIYVASFFERFLKNKECPYCEKKYVLRGVNSIDKTKPELISEWSPNNKRPMSDFMDIASYTALWICPTCKGEYSAPIKKRELGDDSCPYCKKRKFLQKNSFKAKHPDLIKEWDYINNYLLCTPEQIIDTYAYNVWWICKECKKRYLMSPKRKLYYQKRHMKSCVYCKGLRRKKKYYF